MTKIPLNREKKNFSFADGREKNIFATPKQFSHAKKETYLPPVSEELQLQTEAILAASGESIDWGGDYNLFISEFDKKSPPSFEGTSGNYLISTKEMKVLTDLEHEFQSVGDNYYGVILIKAD